MAVVGAALHVPGADGPDRFWDNLRRGVESLRTFTDDELSAVGVPPDALADPNYVRAGMVLENLEMFDAEFFGLSPKEAAIMDPQHRHFLECAWEALERAGHPPEKFGGRIGVFGGCGMGAYFTRNLLSNPELVRSVGMFLLRHTGNDKDFLATRVSYCFDLRGPSVNIQTACSTSLVAVHAACQSLLSGECDLALAGGSTIELPHYHGYLYKKNEILSPDGHCRAFDHRSQGTVFGSGAAVVALRRVEDALRDGDPILAVVKGSAVNNDGAGKVGYFAPSVDGQAAAMAEALAVADVPPESVGYVECHGTGTPIGDPIEVAALAQAYRGETPRSSPLALGSVKTNIGHLDTAAGAAGLIKAALALEHRQLPPSLNFEAPNPAIDFTAGPFAVNDRLNDWPAGEVPRRAAVNSLGVGGTNAHAILEEAPPRGPSSPSTKPYQLLALSARNRAALDAASKRLAAHLREHPEQSPADVSFTLWEGRRAFEHRRVLAARDLAEAAALLEADDAQRVFTAKAPEAAPSVVFMFPGGGAQFPRMGLDLYEAEPVFREWIDRGLRALQGKLDVDLRGLWFAPPEQDAANERLWQRPSIQLPAIFLCEYALAQLWTSWGVKPAALLGHSLGENTAACLAGVLSFDDALGLVALRGRLFEKVAPGGMLSVPLAPEAVQALLGDRLDLATVNSPDFCTVSGADDALDALEAKLVEQGVEVKRVPIRIAAHSRLLEPILGEFEAYLRSIRLAPPNVPIVSNLSGTWLTDAQATDPRYWVEHLRRTVRFADGVAELQRTPGRAFLEVGPGKTLASLVRRHPQTAPQQTVVSSMRHPKEQIADTAFFLTVLGRLWAGGVPIDQARLWQGETRRRVTLPTYAFQRQRYWIEPGAGTQAAAVDAAAPQRIENPADRYFRPKWKRREIDVDDAVVEAAQWLVFLDDAGLGERIAGRLRAAGHDVCTVRAGDAYHQHDGHAYTLAPEHGRDGYDALVRDLVAAGRLPNRIVHLWLTTAEESYRPGSSFFHRNQECGFYSLLFLAQALSEAQLPEALRLTVVTDGMQQVGDEDLPYPEKATVLGPCGVIPREMNAACAVIDVRLPPKAEGRRRRNAERGPQLEALVDRLMAELAEPATNVQAALRDDRRYELTYERRMPKSATSRPGRVVAGADAPIVERLRPRGTYLITGGLGGIGLTVAEHLAKTYKARLALTGRTALPPASEWDAWLRSHAESNDISRKILRVRELESYGAEVAVFDADVTDVEGMRGALAEIARRFGRLHGVIHAAGVLRDNLISLKTQTEAEEVFAPKVHGTLVLDELLADAAPDFFVVFGSTSAALAPAGQVDYVAANAFLNAYACSRRRLGRPVTCLNWGVWNEVGMAVKALHAGRGAAPKLEEQPVAHPWFDYRVGGLHDPQVTLVGRHGPAAHWVYDEHRTAAGQALLPGTAYLELTRAALAESGETRPFELRDLFFLSPLAIDDDQSRDVRVTLARDEQGYALTVQSRRRAEDGRLGWQTHAQGSIVVESAAAAAPAPLDLAAIDARCSRRRLHDPAGNLRTKQEDHLRFGPRWRVWTSVGYGEGEAVATLALPPRYADDARTFDLHPALLDLATGFAMHLIGGYDDCGGLWVPVSYGKVRYFHPLDAAIRSWVRVRGTPRADAETATFDIGLTDDAGRVLVEISEFSIRRLAHSDDFGRGATVEARTLQFDEPNRATHDDDAASPAEAAFRANLRHGIRPEEGAAALVEVLHKCDAPQVIVSSLDVNDLLRQAAASRPATSRPEGAKFERPQLDDAYVAPRDNVERTLAALWEELLGVRQVGVRDGFFELGGHSLIAVRLFAQIKKAFHVDFPMSVLFTAPTVEGVAALIKREIGAHEAESAAEVRADSPPSDDRHRSRYTHLVKMHDGGGSRKTPLFIVAGMFGNVLNLRHLAHLIGGDRPCYGLQARGLYGEHAPHETFEEAAADYLRELRSVQPHGPYLLSGFSGGGIAAYEIARQLRHDGEAVAFLAMLDTPLPSDAELTPLDKLKMHGQRLARERHRYFTTWIRDRAVWEWKKFQRKLRPEVALPAAATFHSTTIEQAFRRACEAYRTPSWDGPLWLFRPKLRPTHVFGPGRMINADRRFIYADNGWGRFAADVRVCEVPGDHDSMVLEPNVRTLGSRLRKAIAEAEVLHGSPRRAVEQVVACGPAPSREPAVVA